MFRKTIWVAILILVATAPLAATSAAASFAAQPQQSANLLTNPNFDGVYTKQCCDPSNDIPRWTSLEHVEVAPGWTAFWIEPDASHPNKCNGCTPWSRPEFVSSSLFAHNANPSQLMYLSYAVNQAGVYQHVNVTPGQRLVFSAYIYGKTVKDNNIEMKVGIDPNGGTNPYASSVIWSVSQSGLNAWLLYSIEATAQSSAVTVFIYGRPHWALEYTAVYFDDASLTVAGAGGNSPSASPTLTSYSGATYTVLPGDSLARVARKTRSTIAALRTANHLTTDVLQPGQVLVIP